MTMPTIPQETPSVIADVGETRALDNGCWIRSFQAAHGTIYLKGGLKSTDAGRTVVPQPDLDVERLIDAPERAVLAKPGMFYALDGPARLAGPGVCRVRGWRPTDELRRVSGALTAPGRTHRPNPPFVQPQFSGRRGTT